MFTFPRNIITGLYCMHELMHEASVDTVKTWLYQIIDTFLSAVDPHPY